MIFNRDKINFEGKHFVFILLVAVAFIVFVCFEDSGFSFFRALVNNQGEEVENSVYSLSKPEGSADIYGMVISVKGNKLTVLKFDVSNMPEGKENSSYEEDSSVTENIISLGQTSSMFGGREMSGRSPGGGFGFGNESSTRQEKLEDLKATSIGTETVEVPIGIPILVGSETQVNQEEIGTLRDLSSDTLVAIWLKEENIIAEEETGDNKKIVANFVSVSGKVDMDN